MFDALNNQVALAQTKLEGARDKQRAEETKKARVRKDEEANKERVMREEEHAKEMRRQAYAARQAEREKQRDSEKARRAAEERLLERAYESAATPGGECEEAKRADIPEDYECPITCVIMDDPVVAADGCTYERSAIEKWLESHDTSPTCGNKLQHKFLSPNRTVKNQVEDWKATNCIHTVTET